MISNQICCYKNSKKLIEFTDKLKEAKLEEYAHLHGQYSLIGVNISDYSHGTGDKLKFVSFNLSPCEVKQIYRDLIKVNDRIYNQMAFAQLYSLISNVVSGLDFFFQIFHNLYGIVIDVKNLIKKESGENLSPANLFKPELLERVKHNPFVCAEFTVYSSQKIIAAQKTESGNSPMSSFTISYIARDQEGKPRTAPWKITIDNGEAKAKKMSTGGFCAEGGTYKSKSMAFVFLTDKEIEKLFRSVCDFITVFETTISFRAIKEGRKEREQEKEGKERSGT